MFEITNSFNYFLDQKKKEDEIIYNYVKDKFKNNGFLQRIMLICKTENESNRKKQKKTETTMKQYFVVFEVKDFEFYKLEKDERLLIVERETYERLKYEKEYDVYKRK